MFRLNRINFKWNKLFIIFALFCFWKTSDLIAETPLMPKDPFSEESFDKIKDYYQIKNGLPTYQLTLQTEVAYEKYKLLTIKLAVKNYPDVVFVLKRPLNMDKPLPAIVLFSGFQTGAQAIQLVGDPDSVVYVGFEYPWPIEVSDQSLKWNWKRIEVIPILMAITLSWLHQSDLIDHQKINVVNVSFGNLFFPLAQRILNQYGIYSKSIVFGYGGVEISEIIGSHLQKKMSPFELEMTKVVIKNQTWMVEPKFHLSKLRGPFLVVNGEDDDVFPKISLQELIRNLSVTPKIKTLSGGHIQPDRTDVISSFMSEVTLFLKENNAL
jgi:hypothetical protein